MSGITEVKRSHHAINRDAPEAPKGAPECPDYVSSDPEAKAYWDHYVQILMDMKVLTVADECVLGNLCVVHSKFLWHKAAVEKANKESADGMGGVVTKAGSGYLSPNPLYTNMQNLLQQEIKVLRELGLTPAARTKISTATGKKDTESPWAKLRQM